MQFLTVSQLTSYLKRSLEADPRLADVWVQGEVSNLRQSQLGHSYFTLKDQSSQVKCVMFRQANNKYAALLQNGAAVLAHGRVSLYEVSGELQLYVDVIQPEGVGPLQLKFEQLKVKLEAEGLFDPARKRPIPAFPQRIAVITSPAGAVLHDICNIIGRRYPLVELLVVPTPVQGDGAVEGIVQSFALLNGMEGIDTVILARGGGSLEELWAFNEERVARAIYGSQVPVVSAIGHETDFTIADFVADLRAPTPSAAAELVVPDREELIARLRHMQWQLKSSVSALFSQQREGVSLLTAHLQRARPATETQRQHLDALAHRIELAVSSYLAMLQHRSEGLTQRLLALSPARTLSRGYALVQHAATGKLISSIQEAKPRALVDIHVKDGAIPAQVVARKKAVRGYQLRLG